jgi:hypothetical protein
VGIFRQLADIVRDIPRFYALKMQRWIIRLHQPLGVGPPDYTWCQACSAPWPCKEFVNASDQINVLTQGGKR